MKTKKELIEIRKATYRDQMPERCCEKCRHFSRWPGAEIGQCLAITIRDRIAFFPRPESSEHELPITGICDLYEPREEA